MTNYLPKSNSSYKTVFLFARKDFETLDPFCCDDLLLGFTYFLNM